MPDQQTELCCVILRSSFEYKQRLSEGSWCIFDFRKFEKLHSSYYDDMNRRKHEVFTCNLMVGQRKQLGVIMVVAKEYTEN